MTNRRQFLNKVFKLFLTAFALSAPLYSIVRKAFSQTTKTIIQAGTSRTILSTMNPKNIDASEISVTPLKDFCTMGITDYKIDTDAWRLKIHGKVEHRLELTFTQIQKLPTVNRKVLMICPGVFANQGIWKGIDMRALLEKASLRKDAENISFSRRQRRNFQNGDIPGSGYSRRKCISCL